MKLKINQENGKIHKEVETEHHILEEPFDQRRMYLKGNFKIVSRQMKMKTQHTPNLQD